MTDLNIGKKITADAQRDAIHIAIAPAVCDADILSAGRRVSLRYGSNPPLAIPDEYSEEAVGIVDPFLRELIHRGEWFWIFLFPGTITGLRHQWTHPAFDQITTPMDEHEAWLRRFAEEWGFDFHEMVDVATDPDDDYITAYGHELHSAGELGADHELFWEHLEAYLQRSFDLAHRESVGWSCSC
jgi:hypothetical protein